MTTHPAACHPAPITRRTVPHSRAVAAVALLGILLLGAGGAGGVGAEPPSAGPEDGTAGRGLLLVTANLGRVAASLPAEEGRAALERDLGELEALLAAAGSGAPAAWIDAGGWAAPEAEGIHPLAALHETPYRWSAAGELARRGVLFAAAGEREALLPPDDAHRLATREDAPLAILAPGGHGGADGVRVVGAPAPAFLEKPRAEAADDPRAATVEARAAAACEAWPFGALEFHERRDGGAAPPSPATSGLAIARDLSRPDGLAASDAAGLTLGAAPVAVLVELRRAPGDDRGWHIASAREAWRGSATAPHLATIDALEPRDVEAIAARLSAAPTSLGQRRLYPAPAGGAGALGGGEWPWAERGMDIVEGEGGDPARSFAVLRLRLHYPESTRALFFWVLREEGRRPRVLGEGRLVFGAGALEGDTLARLLDDALASGGDLTTPLPDEAFLNGELRAVRLAAAAFLAALDAE